MSALVVAGVVLVAVIAVRVLRRRPSGDRPIVARAVQPGLPADGEPLTFDEQRALADVEMDSLIDIAEPVYPAASGQGSL